MSKAADLANLIGNINAGGGGANRNFLINGSASVAQRATSKTGIGATSGYFTCDRWKITTGNTAGELTMTQDSSAPSGTGLANSIKLDCTNADGSIAADELTIIGQTIEAQNLQTIKKGTSSAVPLTASFYAKANASATYVAELYDHDNTRNNTRAFTVGTDWERVELTFIADTTGTINDDNGFGITFQIWLHAGATYSGGTFSDNTWQSVTPANRYAGSRTSFFDSTDRELFLTGLQLEVGQNATEFESEPLERTLARCYRYTQRLPHFDNTAGSGYAAICTVGRNDSTTQNASAAMLPVPMREDPAIESQSGSFRIHHANAGTALSASIATDDNIATAGMIHLLGTVSSGLTAGDGGQLQQNNDADAHLIIEAEL